MILRQTLFAMRSETACISVSVSGGLRSARVVFIVMPFSIEPNVPSSWAGPIILNNGKRTKS